MPVHLLKDLERVKKMILEMGARVEEDILRAITALSSCNRALAEQIIADDLETDRREVQVEEECLKILALHQPVARDLRFLVAVLKMNNDLERMGDHATNIAERVLFLCSRGPVPVPKTMREMADKVNSMVRRSLDSLVEADSMLARAVILSDDEVDSLRDDIFIMITGEMRRDTERLEQWVQLLAATRDLERIADLATNISQDVIYLVEGDVVRHQQVGSPKRD
jgi:phosphate transport system protein